MGTLFVALGLLSCGTASGAAQPAQAVRSEKEAQRPLKELFATEQWKQFGDFWKKLDALEPKRGKYEESISAEQQKSLRAEMEERITGLSGLDGKLISAGQIDLLRRICSERIDIYSFDMTMLSRMMPPPSVGINKMLLVDIESRIDKLSELKKKGKVSEAEFGEALSNIQQDIEAVCAISIIRSKYGPSYRLRKPVAFSGDAGKMTDEAVEAFEKDYADSEAKRKQQEETADQRAHYERLAVQYRETKNAIEQLRSDRSRLYGMISDLEND